MKKRNLYNSLLLACITMVISTGCKKDFLDRQPNGQLTEQEAFSRYSNVNAMVSNLYNRMSGRIRAHYFFRDYINSATGTDEAEANNQMAWPTDLLNTGAWGPSNANGEQLLNNLGWRSMFEDIRAATIVIENTVKYKTPDNDVNLGDLRIRIGEAYFLRAYFYFNLIRLYGDVPLLTALPDVNGDINFSRNPFHKVVEQIAKDCDSALDRLPVKQIDAELGRAEKGAPLALKARALLYAARPLWNGGTLTAADTRKESSTYTGTVDPQKWKRAADAAKAVMDLTFENGSPRYSLYQSFAVTDYVAQTGNKVSRRLNEMYFDLTAIYNEGIFVHGKNKTQAWQTDNYPPANGGTGRAFPSQEQVDEYEMANGKMIKEAGSGYDDQNPYLNRDPRFYRDVMYHGSVFQNVTINISAAGGTLNRIGGGNTSTKTGYYWRKFYREDYKPGGAAFNLHFMAFRYAEILLNYAEAQNEFAGPDASVYNAINQVRNRSFMPNLPTGLSKEQMRERIRHERRIELAYENHRFFDARLWMLPDDPAEKAKEAAWRAAGTLDQRAQLWPYPQTQRLVHGMQPIVNGAVTTYKRFVVEERVFETPKHYLFPISADELSRASNLNPQNPGW